MGIAVKYDNDAADKGNISSAYSKSVLLVHADQTKEASVASLTLYYYAISDSLHAHNDNNAHY